MIGISQVSSKANNEVAYTNVPAGAWIYSIFVSAGRNDATVNIGNYTAIIGAGTQSVIPLAAPLCVGSQVIGIRSATNDGILTIVWSDQAP